MTSKWSEEVLRKKRSTSNSLNARSGQLESKKFPSPVIHTKPKPEIPPFNWEDYDDHGGEYVLQNQTDSEDEEIH